MYRVPVFMLINKTDDGVFTLMIVLFTPTILSKKVQT